MVTPQPYGRGLLRMVFFKDIIPKPHEQMEQLGPREIPSPFLCPFPQKFLPDLTSDLYSETLANFCLRHFTL